MTTYFAKCPSSALFARDHACLTTTLIIESCLLVGIQNTHWMPPCDVDRADIMGKSRMNIKRATHRHSYHSPWRRAVGVCCANTFNSICRSVVIYELIYVKYARCTEKICALWYAFKFIVLNTFKGVYYDRNMIWSHFSSDNYCFLHKFKKKATQMIGVQIIYSSPIRKYEGSSESIRTTKSLE